MSMKNKFLIKCFFGLVLLFNIVCETLSQYSYSDDMINSLTTSKIERIVGKSISANRSNLVISKTVGIIIIIGRLSRFIEKLKKLT